MLKKSICLVIIMIMLQVVCSVAGIEWKTNSKASAKGKDESTQFLCYAQEGNVRQDIVKGSFSPLMKEGSYMLFKKGDNNIYIVNRKDKTYTEIPFDMLMGMAASMIKIEVSDLKVNKFEPEVISKYKCNHVQIKSNYIMKTQFMNMQFKVEQIQDIWGTMDLPLSELSDLFILQSVKTGLKELDDQIAKQTSVRKELGFPIKIVTVMKQSSGKGQEMDETRTIEMESYDIVIKKLDSALFEIPSEYKKVELFSPGMMKQK